MIGDYNEVNNEITSLLYRWLDGIGGVWIFTSDQLFKQIRLITDILIEENPVACNRGLCTIEDGTNLNTKVFTPD